MSSPTIPFRLLKSLLFTTPHEAEWIDTLQDGTLRVYTPEACRDLKIDSAILWKYLYWLEEHDYISSVSKEKKKGTAIVRLRIPPNLKHMLESSPAWPKKN